MGEEYSSPVIVYASLPSLCNHSLHKICLYSVIKYHLLMWFTDKGHFLLSCPNTDRNTDHKSQWIGLHDLQCVQCVTVKKETDQT